MTARPEYPAGPYLANPQPTAEQRRAMIEELRGFPARVRRAVAGLNDAQLEAKYRNWTLKQIVNHLADSHINGYVRTRLALTEAQPTIKPYDESNWSNLAESRTTDIQLSLQLLEALHARWVRTLESLNESDFARTYFHPEHQRHFTLGESLGTYTWHGRHHLAMLELVAQEMR